MMGSNHPTDTGHSPRHDHEDQGEDAVRSTLADLMPWMATILLHAAMVLIAILFVWVTLDRTEVAVEDYVPVTNWNPDQRPALQSRVEAVSHRPSSGPRSINKSPIKTQVTTTQEALDMRIIGHVGQSSSQGQFTGPATGGGDDGIFVIGPDGHGARSFVFVIDASGSMIDTLPFVVAELKRTIRSLSEHQSFAIIFYQGDQVIESAGSLQMATEANKRRAFDWLDGDSLAPSGLSDPISAIERGLLMKPQVMFLLSDNITGSGRYEINQRFLVDRISRANTGKTKINTIQFLYPDPLSRIPGMKPTLQRISDDTGGRYRFLSAKDLGL